MPNILILLIWYAKKNNLYFTFTYLVCRKNVSLYNVIYLECREKCLIFERYLFVVPTRMPHILKILIGYAEKNT